MGIFDALAGPDLRSLDPSGGVLVVTTYWRPRSRDPNPEQPGEKLSILSYLPTDAEELCPCGSGNSFGVCCQLLPYWRPVCPNPGMQGYSLVHPQSARFTNIPADVVYAFLQDDERLYCVEDTPQRAFWTYWGDPAFDTRFHAWRSQEAKGQKGNADAHAEQAWGSVAHPGGDRHVKCNRKETHTYSTAKAELSCCTEKSSGSK